MPENKITTMSELREKNAEIGNYFFSKETMKFFKSKIESEVLYGKYFITSEQRDDLPRTYQIREFSQDGRVTGCPFPHFRSFPTKQEAKDFLKKYESEHSSGGSMATGGSTFAKGGKVKDSMEREVKISYNWRRLDGKEIPSKHKEALEESAMERIQQMMSEGYTSGELHDNITMFEADGDGVDYQGWWGIDTKVIKSSGGSMATGGGINMNKLNSLSLEELGELYVTYGLEDEGEFKKGKEAVVKKLLDNVDMKTIENDLRDIMGKGGKAAGGEAKTPKEIKKRLEELRKELRAEKLSWGELAELQSLAKHIDPSDVELLEAAGVPEFPDDEMGKGGKAGKQNLYFYAESEKNDYPFTVFKVKNLTGFIPDAEDRARTIARENGMKLAGGMTNDSQYGIDDPEKYKVINVPDKTKPTDEKGNILPPPLSAKQEKKLKAESAKTKGKGKKKTKSITVFSFEDLSDDAKEKAIEEYRDINTSYDWWQFTYEDAANIGLKITGFDLDRNKHADGEFINGADECASKIIKEHGDQTSTYKTAKQYRADYDALVEKYSDGVKKNIVAEGKEYDFDNDADELGEEFLKSLLEDYAQMLQDEYEYKYSDEAVKETIEANEYEFMEDGSKSDFEKGGVINTWSDGISWLITG